MIGKIVIESVAPAVDAGDYPVKRVAKERCEVEADIFREGHHVLAAVVIWRRTDVRGHAESPLVHVENDRWRGSFPLTDNTRYVFAIEAWTDVFATWLRDYRKKAEAGEALELDRAEGRALIDDARARAQGGDLLRLREYLGDLEQASDAAWLALVSEPELTELIARTADRHAVTRSPELEVIADRPRARFGAWYEFFPRSAGRIPGKAATLREAEGRLPMIRDLGFDVVYLPPIHPIGEAFRKGKNNALRAEPGDPGSPWAIGNRFGGHTAVDPALGTIEDFDHFVEAARALGLEVALDYAIQCSPDHPWIKEHPEWFHHRPDGSIKYAENPPKKYQDIYPVNFETADYENLRRALLDVLLFWIGHGVRIFRVDNPHTKPLYFWQWAISEVQAKHPDVIFLSEAFTRPKMMKALAKLGFTQSYTYFTWRTHKWELTEYMQELTNPPVSDYFRPNFFANTPDILPRVLQEGGRPAFKQRLVLAATLAPSYGIYSGYELCENEALPGTEEYRNSEKYEIKVRDYHAPGNLNEFIARINAIRRENPALSELTNLRILDTDNDQLFAYCKATADRHNVVLVVVNLDPHNPHHGTVFVPADAVGVSSSESYGVHDLVTEARFTWGDRNYVRLDPHAEPAHVFRVERSGR